MNGGHVPARSAGRDDDERAGALAALAGVCRIGPRHLRVLLAHHQPTEALALLAAGGRRLHPMVRRGIEAATLQKLVEGATAVDPAASLAACRRLGVRVRALGDQDYPPALAGDPFAPAVLFTRGDPGALDARRVGVIGTRNATTAGLATAHDLGCALAGSGVTVVSGLARGIDGAAHRGVRSVAAEGCAVAVVGNGLDRPYPRQHSELWNWVADHGLLMSEWPPGVGPDPWRFPQRNRVLAALCEVVVVVESRERGGSLITAREALDRGIDVMVVPGSPRSRASTGTNQLLVDGAAPVTSVDDIMVVLGLDHRRQAELPFDPRPQPTLHQQRVLDRCEVGACTLDHLVDDLGLSVADAALAAARLERDGWLVEAGGWFEPAGSRLQHP